MLTYRFMQFYTCGSRKVAQGIKEVLVKIIKANHASRLNKWPCKELLRHPICRFYNNLKRSLNFFHLTVSLIFLLSAILRSAQHEDYALAKIAKFEEFHEGWVSDDASDDERLELNYDGKECL